MKYFFFILLFFSYIYTFGQSDSLVNTDTLINNSLTDSLSFNEAKAYKMLYENQIASNNSILNTIFYALGGLGGAILLVFASNWWFNDKKVKDLINDIDTKMLKVEEKIYADLSEKINLLSNKLTEELNKTQKELQEEVTENTKLLTSKFKDFTEKIRKEIKQDNKELLNNYQKQLDSFNINYNQQISTLNSNMNSIYNSLNEKLNDKEKLIKELMSSETNSRIWEIKRINEKIFRNEFYMWDTRGVHVNALTALMNELESLYANDDDLTFYLDQILETCKKLNTLSKYNKKNIENLFKKLPEKYNDLITKILSITSKLPD